MPGCLILVAVAAAASTARAQTDIGSLLTPWEHPGYVEADTSVMLFPEWRGGPHLFETESTGRVRFSTQHEINPTAGWHVLDVQVQHHRGVIPSELTDASVGFGTPIAKSGDYFFAASGAYGYAGDAPFSLGRAWYPQLDALVGRDFGHNRVLTLTVNWGGNSDLLPDVPLPLIEYDDASNPNFEFLIGYPDLSVKWHATDRLTIGAGVDLPSDFSANIDYRVTEQLTLFALYEDEQDEFYVHDLPGNRRLFLEQQRIEAGVRWRPVPAAEVLLAGGYAFGQNFSTGWDVRNLDNVRDLPDQPFVRLGVTLRF